MERDRSRASALTKNRHPFGIATEIYNVELDPLQGRTLILHPEVSRGPVRAARPQLVAAEEAENVEACTIAIGTQSKTQKPHTGTQHGMGTNPRGP